MFYTYLSVILFTRKGGLCMMSLPVWLHGPMFFLEDLCPWSHVPSRGRWSASRGAGSASRREGSATGGGGVCIQGGGVCIQGEWVCIWVQGGIYMGGRGECVQTLLECFLVTSAISLFEPPSNIHINDFSKQRL